MDFAAMFIKLITKNGLVAAFIIIGITTWIAYKIGGLTKGRIHGSAIAIFFGLILAYIGGVVGGGHKGLASIPMFAGVGVMGGAMFRDFAIVSTASGTAAGMAAVDPKLVPYAAMTATFYTGSGCLVFPSILYFATKAIFG